MPNATHSTEQAIAHDLNRCDVMQAIGSRGMKSQATKHRKACFAAIREMNEADGMNVAMTDEQLLNELTK